MVSWVPTFLWSGVVPAGLTNLGSAIKATTVFNTDYGCMRTLCPDCKWQITWWRLEETERTIVTYVPGKVTVLPLLGMSFEYTTWWPSNVRRGRPRARHPSAETLHHFEPHAAVDEALEGVEEQHSMLVEEENDVDEFEPEDCHEGDAENEDVEDEEEESNLHLLLMAEAMEALDTTTSKQERYVQAAREQPCPGNADNEAAAATAAAADTAQELTSAAASEAPAQEPLATAAGSERLPTLRGPTNQAAACMTVEEGKLSYYDSNQCFEAVCRYHQKCRLTRTAIGKRAQKAGSQSGAGRPIGFMLCWLKLGATTNSKEEHFLKASWQFSHAERSSTRAAAKANPQGRI
eukprot:6471461-Amphidinium_carterae.3